MSAVSDCRLWLKLWWWQIRRPRRNPPARPFYPRYTLERGIV